MLATRRTLRGGRVRETVLAPKATRKPRAAAAEFEWAYPSNFYCVYQEKLFGMSIPLARREIVTLYWKHNVRTIVSLSGPNPIGSDVVVYRDTDSKEHRRTDSLLLHDLDDLTVVHLPIPDGKPPTVEQFMTFLRVIEETHARGHAAAVHCWAGKGRTGTMLAGFLMVHDGMGPKEAIAAVRSAMNEPKAVEKSQRLFLARQAPQALWACGKRKRETENADPARDKDEETCERPAKVARLDDTPPSPLLASRQLEGVPSATATATSEPCSNDIIYDAASTE